MSITRTEIVSKVKARIDELVPFDEPSMVLPENALLRPIEALIESELDNATLELLERAPLYLLAAYEHNLYSLAIGDDKVAYLSMPEDFLRLALLWLRGWRRPVQNAISMENPLYKLQRNLYTRGGNAKPVAVLTDGNPLLVGKWSDYACQREKKDYAEANTGYELARLLTINEHSFSPLNAFGSYPLLTASQYVGLAEANRQQRVAAFINHISTLTGIDVYRILDKATPDRRENSQACPLLNGIANIQVSTSSSSLGAATGSGWYNIGSTATVKASPTAIGIFEGWYENGVLVSTSASYSFTVSGNRNLVAKFKIVRYTVTLQSEDTGKGTVSGGGTVDAGQSVSISATPKQGWKFDAWLYNGANRREDIPQNGTFTPTESCTLVAKLKRSTAEVKVNVNNQALGEATGGGTYEIGSSCTVKAMPKECYRFTEWRENGVKVATSLNYTFTVTADRTLTAVFEVVYVTVQTTASAEQGTATVNSSSYVTVPRCTVVNLKATAKEGWTFAYWRVGGVIQPLLGANASYKAEGDVSLEAVFRKPPIYVSADARSLVIAGDNPKYYGRATISKAIGCPVTANCWMQVGSQRFTFSATISAGSTESVWELVHESVPDLELYGWGCTSVSITSCDGYDIQPG